VQFFKFQDEEELTAQDIANVLDRMNQQKKYGQLLFIADTCQAFTLFDKVTAPNILALGTSLRGENAYAHHCKLLVLVVRYPLSLER
jgi:phosphatidylinositol glycan class K